MSIENETHSKGLAGFSLDPALMDCNLPQSTPSITLRQRIENELVGVPLSAQKAALSHLLHLLSAKNANHLNKL